MDTQKQVGYVKSAMTDFGLDPNKYNDTEYICDYFEKCSTNDEVYECFMRKLRGYKQYTKSQECPTTLRYFFDALAAFSQSPNINKMRLQLTNSFFWAFESLGYMKPCGLPSRDFLKNFDALHY